MSIEKTCTQVFRATLLKLPKAGRNQDILQPVNDKKTGIYIKWNITQQ